MSPENTEGFTGMKELTFGEKMVGLTFNPSNDPTNQKLKELYAQIIDLVNSLPVSNDPTAHRIDFMKDAIRQAIVAQMLATKAITWQE